MLPEPREHPRALSPNNPAGIHADEQTLAELLKSRGYATGIFGKWHLGDREPFLPAHHGFDEYLGLPYSNDMRKTPRPKEGYPELPLIEGTRTLKTEPDQSKLTTLYTERAVRFIDANKDRPFLLYVPHSMPHVPLAVSDKFKGKSPRGLYGDVIMLGERARDDLGDKLTGRVGKNVRRAGKVEARAQAR